MQKKGAMLSIREELRLIFIIFFLFDKINLKEENHAEE